MDKVSFIINICISMIFFSNALSAGNPEVLKFTAFLVGLAMFSVGIVGMVTR